MEQQTNVPATVSLAAAVTTVVLFLMTFCMSFVPIVSLCTFLMVPLGWLSGFVALVSGIVGYRLAGSMDDRGKGASLTGIAVSIVYFAIQALMFLLTLAMGGLAVVLSLLGGG